MTKRLLLSLAILSGPVTGGSAIPQGATQTQLPCMPQFAGSSSTPGWSLKWIHLAEPEFEKAKLDLDKLDVDVNTTTDPHDVFVDAGPPFSPTILGGTLYRVKISKATMKVTSAGWFAWR